MNTQLAKLKRIAIFLAGIFTASIPSMAHADWSIIGLGTLDGSFRHAKDINDSGQVVGSSFDASGSVYGFITGPNGVGMTYLAASAIYPLGINESGQVVGTTSAPSHAFITGPNGIGMTDLGAFGGDYSRATGINNSGQVVGESSSASGTHAFITGPNGVGMTDLETLGGRYSNATGINDLGQVVGRSSITDIDSGHAFITGPNGVGMMDLGTLGGRYSNASDINDSGEAVGLAETAHGEQHSFIFSHGGITDLSLLAPVVAAGWTYIYLHRINNNGQMVGEGLHNGNSEFFILSYTPDTVFDPKPIYIPPVPEPETYLMLLGGLGLIGYLARRRKETVI